MPQVRLVEVEKVVEVPRVVEIEKESSFKCPEDDMRRMPQPRVSEPLVNEVCVLSFHLHELDDRPP